MKLEFLIATTNRKDLNFLYPMFQHIGIERVNALVINQCFTIDLPKNIKIPHKNIRVIHTQSKGTSLSRNLALENMQGDIGTFTDDDLVYDGTVLKIVDKCFKDCKNQIITFNTGFIDSLKTFKSYKNKPYQHNLLSLMKVGDSEIFFKKEIKDLIRLDERFGLNCRYSLGEYQIFLTDCFKKNIPQFYIPKMVVYHPDLEHSGHKFTRENAKARGACFKRIFGCLCYLIFPLFAIKKWPLYRKDHSFFKELQWLYLGGLEFKNNPIE